MTGTLRVRRSRGALSGALLILLGAWGALIPFVGPYFQYAYTPDRAWTVTSGRMWLEVLPGAVTLAGGAVVLLSRWRPAGVLGAWLAAVAGAWFAVGTVFAAHVSAIPGAGSPVGGATMMLAEQIGFFIGLGVVIVFLAALALGRFTVVAASDTVPEGGLAPAPETDVAAAESSPSAVTAPQAPGVWANSSPEAAESVGQQPALPRRTATVRPVPVLRRGQRTTEDDADQADAEASEPARTPAAGQEAGQRR